MKKILLTLILATGCSTAFARRYNFKCRNHPADIQTYDFVANDDDKAMQLVTSNDNIVTRRNPGRDRVLIRGCGTLENIQYLRGGGIS